MYTADTTPIHTKILEMPAIFYVGPPHAGLYPPLGVFVYDSVTDTLSPYVSAPHRCDECMKSLSRADALRRHQRTCRVVGRYIIVYVRPSDRNGVHYADQMGGKHVPDAGKKVANVQVQIHRGTTGYRTYVRDAGNRIRFRSLPDTFNENRTGLPFFDTARVYLCTLRRLPKGTGVYMKYPAVFWSHPHVRFRLTTLRPELELIPSPVRTSELLTIPTQMQEQGVACIRGVYDESACGVMDRVLRHVVTECKMVCGDIDLLTEADDSHMELVHRKNRIDLIHPDIRRHFAHSAPWDPMIAQLLGPKACLMHGGLFRLFSTTRTGIASGQQWHMDTDASKQDVKQGPRCILVVIALTDVLKIDQGPTEVVYMSEKERSSTSNPGFEDEEYRIKLKPVRTKYMFMRRGDMMFIDGRTLHRGTTKLVGPPRDWLYFVYGRDELTYLREQFYLGPRSMFYDF